MIADSHVCVCFSPDNKYLLSLGAAPDYCLGVCVVCDVRVSVCVRT